jgi:hypothetical protein
MEDKSMEDRRFYAPPMRPILLIPAFNGDRHSYVLLCPVFNIDTTTCETCGGAVKVIASIEDPVLSSALLYSIMGFGKQSQVDEFGLRF